MRANTVFKVDRNSAGYPARLHGCTRPPASLWFVGRLPDQGRRCVAIVGSRAASAQGREQARALATGLAAASIDVVSGGAFGIDAAAHEGALVAGGPTYAVLGCGPDVVYPDRHAALFARIAATGGLLAEHPAGTPPKAGHFPTRNRLIVGLAQAVVVVEAAPRSGALITARLATTAKVPLLAVAGSPGTDALLTAGQAGLCASVSDVTAALEGRVRPAPPIDASAAPAHVAPLLAALAQAPADAATLGRRLGLSLGAVMSALSEAEIDGWIRRRPGNVFEVRLGH